MPEKQYSQLGQVETTTVLRWRKQTSEQNLAKINVLRIMVYWWLKMDPETQLSLYHLPAEELEAFFVGVHDADGDELKITTQQYRQALREKEAG